jgi:hypothetical protein
MRPLLLVVMGVVGFVTVSAFAQNPPATTPVRVAGAIEKLDGDNLTVKTKEGQAVTVTLNGDAAIFGVEKRSVVDIKPGDFLASGGIKGGDGKIHAIEVRIFPEALRGIGEGQRPWDAKPDGVMTNATVGNVTQSPEGGVVRVTYKIRTANQSSRSAPRFQCWLMSPLIVGYSSLARGWSRSLKRNRTVPSRPAG